MKTRFKLLTCTIPPNSLVDASLLISTENFVSTCLHQPKLRMLGGVCKGTDMATAQEDVADHSTK